MDRNSKRIWLSIPWRKLSFFQVIFFSLFFILFISSTMQVLLYKQGVDRSLNRWENDRFRRLEKVGVDYFLKNKEPRIPEPFTIYDKEKRPLITNRRGMMMMDHAMFPLKDKRGEILGYISTRVIPFKEVEENRELLNSLLTNLLISALISLFLSLFLSYFISKRLSHSAIEIKEALNSIKNSKKKISLDVKGAREIVEIGEGVKDLAYQLEKEEELRIQWLHDISHDLKTPVTALKTQFESMIYGVLPINKERIEKNNKEVLRLESLILSMNELMNVETPDLDLKLKEISIGSLFKDLKDRFVDSVNSNKKLNFSFNENIQILGDRSLLFKAISNLIDNAIKYSDEGAEINCTFENSKISVSNSGKEFSPIDKKHLFDRLYRGDSSRNSEGSGLGLSIVKAIIDKHKWHISVESNNGINSFIISII